MWRDIAPSFWWPIKKGGGGGWELRGGTAQTGRDISPRTCDIYIYLFIYLCGRATQKGLSLCHLQLLLFMWKLRAADEVFIFWSGGGGGGCCFSNLLYLISALNQDSQPATAALQRLLRFSIQIASCCSRSVCVCVCPLALVILIWRSFECVRCRTGQLAVSLKPQLLDAEQEVFGKKTQVKFNDSRLPCAGLVSDTRRKTRSCDRKELLWVAVGWDGTRSGAERCPKEAGRRTERL